jgi:hypothetical protein
MAYAGCARKGCDVFFGKYFLDQAGPFVKAQRSAGQDSSDSATLLAAVLKAL